MPQNHIVGVFTRRCKMLRKCVCKCGAFSVECHTTHFRAPLVSIKLVTRPKNQKQQLDERWLLPEKHSHRPLLKRQILQVPYSTVRKLRVVNIWSFHYFQYLLSNDIPSAERYVAPCRLQAGKCGINPNTVHWIGRYSERGAARGCSRRLR